MTNLIPPEAKTELVRLYWIRMVSVWALLWSVLLLVGALLLYPTYLLLTGTSAAYIETVASVSERTEAYDLMVTDLNRSSQEAKTIVQAAGEVSLSGLLQDMWSVNGGGIDIAGVQMARDVDGITPIGITGEAINRQSLALFRDRLEALPYVAKVNLPIENLAENQDITFSILVTINSDNL